MSIKITESERIRTLKSENARLRAELDEASSIVEYIAICDHPEVFGEQEEEENE